LSRFDTTHERDRHPATRHRTTEKATLIIIIIRMRIRIITDLYGAFRSEDTEALDAAQED